MLFLFKELYFFLDKDYIISNLIEEYGGVHVNIDSIVTDKGLKFMEEDLKKSIKRLYKQAKYALLTGDKDIAKDLLIQNLYLSRRDIRAKKMLARKMIAKIENPMTNKRTFVDRIVQNI